MARDTLTIDDDFFIDSNGYVIVEDPQHGHGCRLRRATLEDQQVWLQKINAVKPRQFRFM